MVLDALSIAGIVTTLLILGALVVVRKRSNH